MCNILRKNLKIGDYVLIKNEKAWLNISKVVGMSDPINDKDCYIGFKDLTENSAFGSSLMPYWEFGNSYTGIEILKLPSSIAKLLYE